ncbi:hypothetical protein AKJ09_09076 [Labilithrix luteola]|uniref:Uncharacterized protein n=1 Tax=Labilithrix luteola TaxID=1391654 RepID=A0A0K1Q9K4_9BACT|nr:hypothetical protein AKJ09_09076 [Labilithrix luteola]
MRRSARVRESCEEGYGRSGGGSPSSWSPSVLSERADRETGRDVGEDRVKVRAGTITAGAKSASRY